MTLNDARQKMAESLSSLVELKITVPLSAKTKNIHTNTWIYYEPVEFGERIEGIYGEMKNLCKDFRYTFYRKNYWYVKGVDISYKNGTMDLTLSPMPTPYKQEKLSKSNSTVTSSSANNNSNNSSTSNGKGDGIKAPNWLSKSDRKWAEKFVRDAGKGTDDKLKRAKRVYEAWRKRYDYTFYYDLKYTTPKGNREKAFRRGYGNCADGANILCTLMLTAGVNARIKHPPDHYIVKLKIDGKTYWVDNFGSKSWNNIWRGKTSNSESNITDGVWING